ncbi:MAG: hypothetical protein ACQETE_12815 [Bacteroidota bacterium]|jgi:type III secretory pathway component EscU
MTEQKSSDDLLVEYRNWVSIALIFMIVLGGGIGWSLYSPWVSLSISIGIVLTAINTMVGYLVIDKYFGAAFNQFMKMVFGSMMIRLLLMGLIVVLILIATKINQIGFTVGLFISYILFSLIEVIFINKKASNSNR